MNFWIKFIHSTLDVQCRQRSRRPTPSAHHLAIMHHFFWISYRPCCWVTWYATRNNSNLLSSLFLPFPLIVPSFHTPTLTHSSLWHRSKNFSPYFATADASPFQTRKGDIFFTISEQIQAPQTSWLWKRGWWEKISLLWSSQHRFQHSNPSFHHFFIPLT